jgi:hypothetical protein
MRRTFFALIVLSGLVVACQDQNSTQLQDAASADPVTIAKFLKDNNAEEWLVKEFKTTQAASVKECGGEEKNTPLIQALCKI